MPSPVLFELRALDLGFRLSTTVLTDGPSFSKSVQWESTPIMNRSAGVVNYNMSSNMEFSITLDFFATDRDKYIDEVVRPVSWLLALTQPKQPGVLPPSRCAITFGQWFVDWLCVATSISVSAPKVRAWTHVGGPMNAGVTCSFLEVDLNNTPASRWARGGEFQDLGRSHPFPPRPWGGV